MTKTIEERLEEQEEVLQLMLTKLQTLENRKIEFPDIRVPDYSNQLEILKKDLLRVNHSYPVEKIDEQITRIKNLSVGIPEVIKVRRYHYFEDRCKVFIIGAVVLLLMCAISVGVAISMWKENGRIEANSVKFRIMRQVYPKATYWADTLYGSAPESITRITDNLEIEQIASERSQRIADEKINEAKNTAKKLDQLQRKLRAY
jgi:hypothetical protein